MPASIEAADAMVNVDLEKNSGQQFSVKDGVETNNGSVSKESKTKKKTRHKKVRDEAEVEDERSQKQKRKSRLSLNTEIKNKNKFKDGNNQASIVTFFSKLSPKADEIGKSPEIGEDDVIAVEESNNSTAEIVNPSDEIVEKGKENESETLSNCKKSSKRSYKKRQLKAPEKANGNEVSPVVKKSKNRQKKQHKSDEMSEELEKMQDKTPKEASDRKVRFSAEVQEYSPKRTPNQNCPDNEDDQNAEQLKPMVRNAFAFMMDSRNKSIGQNLEGKEKEKSEDAEVGKESKEALSARKAKLQEWAESKGSAKRAIEDEERGVVIEHKLKKRANRLKRLLFQKQSPNNEDKTDKGRKVKEIVQSNNEQNAVKARKRKRQSTDEDDESLNKIVNKRKKAKLIISSDSSNSGYGTVFEETVSQSSKSNQGASLQQTNLSSFLGVLNKETPTVTKSKLQTKKNSETEKKTKSKSKIAYKEIDACDDAAVSDNISKGRDQNLNAKPTPSRSKQWKMRIKVDLSNVDDEEVEKLIELRINVANNSNGESDFRKGKKKVGEMLSISDSESDNEPLASKTYVKKKPKEGSEKDKCVKLAPLFNRAKPKPKMDEATKEARRKFLHSGIPDVLKKSVEKRQKIEETEYDVFPTVSHIRIKPTNEELASNERNFWSLPKVDLKLSNSTVESPKLFALSFGSVTASSLSGNNETINLDPVQRIFNIKNTLKLIKNENPDYPVYKVFRFLYEKRTKVAENNPPATAKNEARKPKKRRSKSRRKKIVSDEEDVTVVEEPVKKHHGQELWTDLYRPSSSEEIFGNRASVLQLKSWLEAWLEFGEEANALKSARRKRHDSDSCSDFENVDGSSRDAASLPANTTILCGSHGTGKTMAVYALCNELGINVLELNASSKRTGKRLLQELQEATQSHQVRKNDSSALSTYLKKEEAKPSPQSAENQSSTLGRRMCLLLVEDVDIVFEQDENFVSALFQLLAASKRPVVLTTTDTNCVHLKKFFALHKVVTFSPLPERILATWMQVLCLLEGLHVDQSALAELLEFNKGDVRSTLLQLQFWAQSGGQLKSKTSHSCAPPTITDTDNPDLCKDDSSNISWFNNEVNNETENLTVESFIHINWSDNHLKNTQNPSDLSDLWWNVASDLNMAAPLSCMNNDNKLEGGNKSMKNLLNVFETLAETDNMYTKLSVSMHKNEMKVLKDSLQLSESQESCCSNKDFCYDWTNTLYCGHIKLYKSNDNIISNAVCAVNKGKHWSTKQKKCDEVLTEAVPFGSHLDRNAMNMDYLSTLRTMARSEAIRAQNNNKRKNRFYNYLRGVGVTCNDLLFNTVCGSFQCES